MSVRRRRIATAAGIVAAVTAGGALLTGCGPRAAAGALGAPTAAASSPAATATGSAQPSTGASAAVPTAAAPSSAAPTGVGTTASALNGTAGTRLTISNGTRYVVMNGTTVDFGVAVRDLAWSPDGRKAAFVDGSGNLEVANPDGSGRVTVARNPGGQTWSHPTWQVTPTDNGIGLAARDNLFFAASRGGVTRLETVKATLAGQTPQPLPLDDFEGPKLPQTGNVWPNAGGSYGSAVYANTGTGDVYIRDDYTREQAWEFTSGSEPALSADGNEIVFVRSVGGHDHIFTEPLDVRNPVARDITPGATTDYTEPAFSPDGRTVAVRTPNGVAVLPSNGSAAPRLISTTKGLPAYRG
jgi:hypothetical protein